MKVAISVPEPVFREAEQASKRLRMSRSRLYSQALAEFVKKHRGQILEASIDRVPEGYRTVFMLRQVEGLSTADTAVCLSIPEETVKTRLHRARQQLRRQLDQALGTLVKEAFTFGFERCDRLVTAVLRRLACSDAR